MLNEFSGTLGIYKCRVIPSDQVADRELVLVINSVTGRQEEIYNNNISHCEKVVFCKP